MVIYKFSKFSSYIVPILEMLEEVKNWKVWNESHANFILSNMQGLHFYWKTGRKQNNMVAVCVYKSQISAFHLRLCWQRHQTLYENKIQDWNSLINRANFWTFLSEFWANCDSVCVCVGVQTHRTKGSPPIQFINRPQKPVNKYLAAKLINSGKERCTFSRSRISSLIKISMFVYWLQCVCDPKLWHPFAI